MHVRYALPGETVLARPEARNRIVATAILDAGADRAAPPCPLFGECGGCVLQHMDPAVTLRWKAGLVEAALRGAGFALPAAIQRTQSPPGARRRMDLAVRRGSGGAVVVGLHVRGDERVVPMTRCSVLHPALLELVLALPPVLARLQGLRRTGSANVNLFTSGPDLLLSTDAPLVARDRAILADFAAAHRIPRISWRPETGDALPEPVCNRVPVSHRLGGLAVAPPPGAFLQATPEGEAAIVAAVLAALPDRLPRAARVIELHAGCGTLGLPLSERAGVLAYENDAAAVACLRVAADGRRLSVARRDLNRQPLLAREFAGAAAVVLDPPHGGAAAQIRELAGADVSTIAYVSCNPASLGADAAHLARAGFRLDALAVIDQFLWSARVESVSVFRRPVTPRRGPLPRPLRP